jgi:hypothetical protein
VKSRILINGNLLIENMQFQFGSIKEDALNVSQKNTIYLIWPCPGGSSYALQIMTFTFLVGL